jgi:hypothetical protein
MAEQEVNIPRERTTVWVLEHVIDGHYVPEAYFATELIANDTVKFMSTYVDIKKWRVVERDVWFRPEDYVNTQDTHMAKWLRRITDPEYAEFKRLEEKFKVMK